MVKVTYVEHDGTPHEVDVAVGRSVMKGAVDHAIPGIDADCGGACACATCHVRVPDEWRHLTGEPGADEREMLECALDVTPGSRLSCQIVVTEMLDGLMVYMPSSQR